MRRWAVIRTPVDCPLVGGSMVVNSLEYRRAVRLLQRAADLCLALDIGASKLGAAMVDREGGTFFVAESPTPEGRDAEALFGQVTNFSMASCTRKHGQPLALGVGSAGPLTNGSQVSPLNIPAWRDFPLRRRLEDRFGLATFLEVDTKALALAEGWRGAAQGSRNYLAMVVSSGIGGGLVLDGRLVEGRTGNAGHVGHVIIEPGWPPVLLRRPRLPGGRSLGLGDSR